MRKISTVVPTTIGVIQLSPILTITNYDRIQPHHRHTHDRIAYCTVYLIIRLRAGLDVQFELKYTLSRRVRPLRVTVY